MAKAKKYYIGKMAAPTSSIQAQSSLLSTPHVMMIPMQQNTTSTVRSIPYIRSISITTFLLAAGSIAIGIAAVLSKSRLSYVGDPLWTGLFFMLPCGILGLYAHNRKSIRLNIALLVMVILSGVASCQMFIFSAIITDQERWLNYCQPNPFDYYYSRENIHCAPQFARMMIDAALALCALVVLVLNIILFSLTLYGTCMCCYQCCNDTPNTNANTWIPLSQEFVPQNIQVTPAATSATSQALPMPRPSNSNQFMVITPVGSPQSTNQITQPVYVMQPATDVNPSQPVSNYQQPSSSPAINQQVSQRSGVKSSVQPGMVRQPQPPLNRGNGPIAPTVLSAPAAPQSDKSTANPPNSNSNNWEKF